MFWLFIRRPEILCCTTEKLLSELHDDFKRRALGMKSLHLLQGRRGKLTQLRGGEKYIKLFISILLIAFGGHPVTFAPCVSNLLKRKRAMWQYTSVLKSFKYSMIPGWLLKYVLSPSKILYNPLKKTKHQPHFKRHWKNIKLFIFFCSCRHSACVKLSLHKLKTTQTLASNMQGSIHLMV